MTYLPQYQSANQSNEQSIRNFVVRKKELRKVMYSIGETDAASSIQHFVFVGRRGSGKSTLLRRIQAEIATDQALAERFVVCNLSEEQAGVYKLHDLWDYALRDLKSQGYAVEEPDWQDYADDMKAYTHRLYAEINSTLHRENKGMILLIDNIDRIFKNIGEDKSLLREQLMNYNYVRIIGGSTIMSEDFWSYGEAFYQYFDLVRLARLKQEEIKALLEHWAEEKDLPELATFVERHPGKLAAIRTLTDGTPRTMQLFVDMLINRPLQQGFDYLRQIIDHATPIYQERLLNLSKQQQKIVVELSFFWEATPVDQLIKVCKMPGKTISAQLQQLVKSKIIEKVKGPTKNHLYRLEERFFNLWLLMTQGGPRQKRDAKYLTIFLEHWYDQAELKGVYQELVTGMESQNLRQDYLVSMTKAMAHSRHISVAERDSLLEGLQSRQISADLKMHLPETVASIYQKANELIETERYADALEALLAIEQEDARKYELITYVHYTQKEYDKAIETCKKVISLAGEVDQPTTTKHLVEEEAAAYGKQKHLGKLYFNLANLYRETGKVAEAERYYLQAIDKGQVEALNNLAHLYRETGKLAEAERYYLPAIDERDVDALYNLALLYYAQNKKQKEALALLKRLLNGQNGYAHTRALRCIFSLWAGEMEAYAVQLPVVLSELVDKEELQGLLRFALLHLLIHHQQVQVRYQFEEGPHAALLQAQMKPLYYACLRLIDADSPILLTMPPELEEVVQDIIKQVTAGRELYYA